jgi:isopenicillin N synthase-like dioxygenase
VRHSPVNRNTRPNFSESFYITRDRAPDHPDIINNKPLVGLNRWPEDMPEFRAATTAYYRAMETMTKRLVPLSLSRSTCRPIISPRRSPSRTARFG